LDGDKQEIPILEDIVGALPFQKCPSGLGMGYRQSNIANPYIKMGNTRTMNLGLDLAIINNRISLVVDAYDKTSKDMLMQLQLPSYLGTRGNASSALAALMAITVLLTIRE
jgi:hypothetical protein